MDFFGNFFSLFLIHEWTGTVRSADEKPINPIAEIIDKNPQALEIDIAILCEWGNHGRNDAKQFHCSILVLEFQKGDPLAGSR